MSPLLRLRRYAITHSLFPPTTLQHAINRIGFVQADPIRAPARAQDLILRHRVESYRAGDLERSYPSLELEEDVLYAYGFVPRSVWRLIHPRTPKRLSAFERKVLAVVERLGPVHPKDLEKHFGHGRVVNAWGGYSKATTHALDQLQYYGFLRIARRDNGIRVYEAARAPAGSDPGERLTKLILIMANILAPVQKKTLRLIIARYRHIGNVQHEFDELLKRGRLEQDEVAGVTYIWPTTDPVKEHSDGLRVRFLAPFDPIVWDRKRFEHLWQWTYRFEAYTPPPKRIRGYYAMPLLWRERIIGWANASVADRRLNVDVGFVDKKPKEKEFRVELEAEIARLETFLDISRLR